MDKSKQSSPDNPGVTISHVLGEITWLMSQSSRHSSLPVGDLGWLAMPAIALRQFHIFRDGVRPIGVALWAYPPASAAEKLERDISSPSARLEPQDWTGGQTPWLMDIVAPFATVENRQLEIMLGDLMTGPFAGHEFYMPRLEPDGTRSITAIPADAGKRLVADLAQTLSSAKVQ